MISKSLDQRSMPHTCIHIVQKACLDELKKVHNITFLYRYNLYVSITKKCKRGLDETCLLQSELASPSDVILNHSGMLLCGKLPTISHF